MDPITTSLLSIILVLCLSAYVFLTWNYDYWKKRGVLGPKPSFLFGNLPSIIKMNRHYIFDIQELYEKYKNCGESFIGIFMTRHPVVLVLDPKLGREVMIYNFKCFRNNEQSLWVNKKEEEISVRNPFMVSHDEGWKEKRSELMGGFSQSRMMKAYPIFTEIGKKMSQYVRSQFAKSNHIIDVNALIFKYTGEVYANFAWGIDLDAFSYEDVEDNVILHMSRRLFDLSFLRIDLVHLSGLLPGLKRLLKNTFYDHETDNFFKKLQQDVVDMRYRLKGKRTDFLDYMLYLKKKKNITTLDMAGHSLAILLDAYDTTRIVVFHNIYFLAKNQMAQEKLRQEIMANLDENGEMSYKTLISLEYLDQCLLEAIRLMNPIVDFSKVCTETTYFQNSENKRTKIEKGMLVHISPFVFHRDPDIFPNPEEFIPERFDNGNAKSLIESGYFLPFGGGPRICAGKRLGQLESKYAVFEIIKNFKLTLCETTPSTKLTKHSKFIHIEGELPLHFEEINK